ncbi:MAG: hypothetical protein ACTHKX_00760 [Pseudolysinimonas sp.]
MTMNTVAHELGYSCDPGIRGPAGVAVRLGEALERWGRQAAEPLDREHLELLQAIRREASAVVDGNARAGAFRLI